MLGRIPGSFTEKVLCSIDEPALIFDDALTIQWANPSAEVFFGHSIEYMHGRKCISFFSQHMECMDRCPVQKCFETGLEEVLAVNTLNGPKVLIEALPLHDEGRHFTLCLIHFPPENHRKSALKRDLAASLNSRVNLSDAADTVLDSLAVLAFVERKGLYILEGDHFMLYRGNGVPGRFPASVMHERIPGETFFLEYGGGGGAVYPVSDEVFLLAGRDSWGSKSRSMLELVGEVLQGCIHRLIPPGASAAL